ncbi:MAG: c-type cytochrome domain-containing protein [Candidatus Sumerlaeia bacterium]|nr:c-type cytochrome domain-containing protein [Candidatus Sumerlaeia bacterium]
MNSNAVLGIAFLALAVAAAGLMLWLWGFPYDEERGETTAPKPLLLLHRCLGYGYTAIYFVMMSRMVPRLWEYTDELPARSALHALLGVLIGAVLLVKVAIVRFFKPMHRYLPFFGVGLLLLTAGTVGLPMATVWREHALHREAAAVSPEPARLAAGRAAFFAECARCHDSRRVLTTVKARAEWAGTVERMSGHSVLLHGREIPAPSREAVVFYLAAIRGAPEPAAAAIPGPEAAEPAPPRTSPTELTEPASTPPPAAVATADAERLGARVAALLAARCAKCHAGVTAAKGVRLDSLREAARSRAVVPGDPDGSELVRRVRGESLPRMPLDGPPHLSAAEVSLLEEWVRALAARPGPETVQHRTEGGTTDAGVDGPAESGPTTAPSPEPTPAPPPRPAPGERVRWDHVEPILMANCVRCHAPSGVMGPAPEGLALTSLQGALAGGERLAVVPGMPEASALWRRIAGLESPRMPFDGPPWLSKEDTDLIARWIRDGARDAAGTPAPAPVGAEVRLEGTLDRRWSVDGAPFRVTGSTELRDIATGGRVRVRAVVGPDGGLVAERVRGED